MTAKIVVANQRYLWYDSPTKGVKPMAVTLDNKLVVGISSRALFDLEYENSIYEIP